MGRRSRGNELAPALAEQTIPFPQTPANAAAPGSREHANAVPHSHVLVSVDEADAAPADEAASLLATPALVNALPSSTESISALTTILDDDEPHLPEYLAEVPLEASSGTEESLGTLVEPPSDESDATAQTTRLPLSLSRRMIRRLPAVRWSDMVEAENARLPEIRNESQDALPVSSQNCSSSEVEHATLDPDPHSHSPEITQLASPPDASHDTCQCWLVSLHRSLVHTLCLASLLPLFLSRTSCQTSTCRPTSAPPSTTSYYVPPCPTTTLIRLDVAIRPLTGLNSLSARLLSSILHTQDPTRTRMTHFNPTQGRSIRRYTVRTHPCFAPTRAPHSILT